VALINRAGQEVSAKVVYYGPGLSGKTTNLEVLFRQVPEDHRGKMISMKTRTDRTLFFDLLPLSGDAILDFNVRILLYTVPGQVYYNATRRLVLKGVDAVVFVADSQRGKMEENLESLENLRSNLADMNLKLEDLPWVIQYNKRDLPDVLGVQELEHALNPTGVPCFSAVAPRGEGVQETLRGVTEHLRPHLRALVEREIGESLRSGSAANPGRSTPPVAAQPPQVEMPALRPAAPAPPRSGLNLDQLPDPRVVEIAPGDLHDQSLRGQRPLVDLMEGSDVRHALHNVETTVDASPLRSLADTLPARGSEGPPAGAQPPDRLAAAPFSRPVPRVVPEIVELDSPSAAPPAPAVPPTPPRPAASAPPLRPASPAAPVPPAATTRPGDAPPIQRSAPLWASPPLAAQAPATPPAAPVIPRSAPLWASAPPAPSAPPAAAAPPAPSGAAAPPPSASESSSDRPLTLRVPRALLERGELQIRLIVEEAPAPSALSSAGGGGGLAEPGASRSSAAFSEERTADLKPSLSLESDLGAPVAPVPQAAPEPVASATAAPGRAGGVSRPAGTGMRFALRNGELVPLD